MKLLRVISSMNPKKGGPSQGIRNLNPHLLNKKIEVDIVCMDDPKLNYLNTEDLTIHNVGSGLTSYQYNKNLDKWLNEHIAEYDFVTVHGIWQYHNFAVYKAIKNLKKKGIKAPKVTIMPHGMLDPYFQKATDRRLKALRNELIWRITEKKAINSADALFFTCEEELILARTTFKGYKPKREINIGYGIKHAPIFEEEMKANFEVLCPEIRNKNYWLFLSRIHPKKGIDLLIDVYNKLIKEGHQLPELVIAGPTDSKFAKKMVSHSQENKHIHFPGMVSGNTKWGLFYGCEAFLLPSYQENFGIAIVEAMACKKPVLITKQINIWMEIQNGHGGWVLETPNKIEIEKQLLTLSALSKNELQKKGEQAFSTFEEKFLVDFRVNDFIEALKSLL